jgi:hypothetical protein
MNINVLNPYYNGNIGSSFTLTLASLDCKHLMQIIASLSKNGDYYNCELFKLEIRPSNIRSSDVVVIDMGETITFKTTKDQIE